MRPTLTITALAAAATMNTTYAQFDRSKQPEPGPPPSISLPALQRTQLDNGLGIIVVEHHELPVVQMQMVIRTGSAADPIGKAGLAYLTSDLIDEGTATRSALELADEIDFLGASVSSSSSFDGSFVNLTTLKENLDKAGDLFADVVLHPSLPQGEYDRLKKELLTDLLQEKDRPDMISTKVFYSMLYGRQHPYGFQVQGTEATAGSLMLDDVKSFYSTYYVPNNATLVAVGDVSKDEVVALAGRLFSSWSGKPVTAEALPAPPGHDKTTLYLVDKANAPQSQIRIGNVAVPRNSPDYYAVSVLNQILGSSNGRLYLNLREAKGYTYGAYSQFNMRKTPGPFIAQAGVRTDVTDSSMIEFMKEIKRMRDELVPEDEFAMYKAAVIQRLPRIFETPGQISGQLSGVVVYNLPDTYFDQLVQNYSSVTREDVRRAAQTYLQPEKLSIVIVGDTAKVREKLEKLNLGPVVLCDEQGNEIAH